MCRCYPLREVRSTSVSIIILKKPLGPVCHQVYHGALASKSPKNPKSYRSQRYTSQVYSTEVQRLYTSVTQSSQVSCLHHYPWLETREREREQNVHSADVLVLLFQVLSGTKQSKGRQNENGKLS